MAGVKKPRELRKNAGLTIKLEQSLLEEAKELARLSGLTMSGLVCKLLSDSIAKNSEKLKAIKSLKADL